ncbi:CHAT domain-containing protein [Cyanobacteria bacterium FACHB-471]|nr:CHAT domain-containing protein [Cyanobacteria bacterium FACHB-471]
MKSTIFGVAVITAMGLQFAIALLPAYADPVPARNATGTRVQLRDGRFDIEGGRLSSDRTNLFHDFERFNLNRNQVANFLSNSEIRNIFSRVTGGDASYINGLLQVSGGNSNLYLINPSGILFGPNARLDVPASFTATTATGIGFGDIWLNALDRGNYEALVGNPSAFSFATMQPGAIVNAGNLAVSQGQQLMLLGGTVINTGTLSAPGGSITIAAIPGENRVRLSQDGMLLSLELELLGTDTTESSSALPFTPLSLPALLTGGNVDGPTGVTINPDGTVQLTGSGITLPTNPGTAIASGTIDASNQTISSATQTPEINVLGDRVALLNTTLNASGINGGGTVRIGGDYQGQGTVFNASRTFVSSGSVINADAIAQGNGGRVIVWADEVTGFYGNITARGGLTLGNGGFVEISGYEDLIFRGTADLSATNGNVGTLLLDPTNIVIADGVAAPDDAQIDDNLISSGDAGETFTISEQRIERLASGADVRLEATNNITINDLTDNSLNIAQSIGSLAFIADADEDGFGSFSMTRTDEIVAPARNVTISGVDITLGRLDTGAFARDSGSVTLNATRNIVAGEINTVFRGAGGLSGGAINLTAGESITIQAQGDRVSTAGLFSSSNSGNGGDITLRANGDISFLTCAQSGICIQTGNSVSIPGFRSGSLTLIADADRNSSGSLVVPQTSRIVVPGRDVNISSTDIILGELLTDTSTTDAGSITLDATGNVSLVSLDSTTQSSDLNNPRRAGNITINAGGTVDIGNRLRAWSDTGSGGIVRVEANSGIFINRSGLNSRSAGIETFTEQGNTEGETISVVGDSGNITLISGGEINVAGRLNAFNVFGRPGNITLRAVGDITTRRLNTEGRFVESGTVQITSTAGSINTNLGTINSSSRNSSGGRVSINAPQGNITTGTINTQGAINAGGEGNSGSITLTSGGNINATSGTLNSSSSNGNAGAITFNASGTIQTGALNTSAVDGQSGSIALRGTSIRTGNLNVFGALQLGGNISLLSDRGITTGNINTSGAGRSGNAVLRSDRGSIRTGNINTSSAANGGTISGDVTVAAQGRITTGGINSSSNQGRGGTITLTGIQGNLPQEISTGNLNSSGETEGGDITVEALNSITTERINTSSNEGNGGNVTLDPIDFIQVTSINAQGGTNGTGGNVTATTNGLFRATGTFRASNGVLASISTAGGVGGGDITLTYDLGLLTPFIVGDAALNGTQGAITSGEFTIPVNLDVENPFSTTTGNIRLITTPGPFESPIEPELPQPLDDEPIPLELPQRIAPDLRAEGFFPEPEPRFTNEFEESIDLPDTPVRSVESARQTLDEVEAATGVKSALLYIYFKPESLSNTGGESADTQASTDSPDSFPPQPTDRLALAIVTSAGYTQIPLAEVVTRSQVDEVIQQFIDQIRISTQTTDTVERDSDDYLVLAQQLYQWFISPLEAKLQSEGIQTIAFIPDAGVRSVPFAALHNGNQFLIEKYSMGLMPSFSLTDTRYSGVNNAQILAMGASDFVDSSSLLPWARDPFEFQNRSPLPSVPVELEEVDQSPWTSLIFLNNSFVPENLRLQRSLHQSQNPFPIVHLATHATFSPSTLDRSYIQFWNIRLRLDQLHALNLDSPPLELLVLSACQTALGDVAAEFGFAGMAVKAGSKSALASLWNASDLGSLILMREFYRQLATAPTKAVALQRAQQLLLLNPTQLTNSLDELQQELITLLESDRNQFEQRLLNYTRFLQQSQQLSDEERVRFEEEVIRVRNDLYELEALLNTEESKRSLLESLSHPFYWSTYTMVGSPW